MKKNIYWLILTNSFRVFRNQINEKTERIFPEFKNISTYVIYIYLLTQLFLILILLIVNFQENQFVNRFTADFRIELIMLKFFIEIIILTNIYRFSFPFKIHMIYGILPSMFYILCSNFKHFFTLLLIQLIYLKLFHLGIFISLFLLSCGILFAFLYAKLLLYKYTKFIMNGCLVGSFVIIFFSLSKELLKRFDINLQVTNEQIHHTILMIGLAVLVLFFTRNLFQKVKQTNYKFKNAHYRSYIKSICFSVIFLVVLLILSQTFEIFEQVQSPLVLMSFLLISLWIKVRFVNFLTIETYGYFLFYLKILDRQLQKKIIKDIRINNYLFLLPVLLIHLFYLLIQQDHIFFTILLCLYVLDIQLDELVTHITRKVVKNQELPNLFIHSKKGLSSVLLIAFIPVALISFIVKSNQSPSTIMGINILIILFLLFACVSLVAHIWRRSFFEDLFK